MLKKKIRPNFQRIIELFTQKNLTKLSKIWVWDPGSKIRDPGYEKTYSGVKKAPDPGSGSATLGATISGIPYWYDTVQNIGMCTGVLPQKETKGMQLGRYRYWYGSKVWYH